MSSLHFLIYKSLILFQGSQPASSPAANSAVPDLNSASGGNLVIWLAILVAMALLPFILTMITSFAKLVVVGGILKQALGTQEIPPTSVITGLALILTIHIMSPVIFLTARGYNESITKLSAEEQKNPTAQISAVIANLEEPLRGFLQKNSSQRNRELFAELRDRLFARADPKNPLKWESIVTKDTALERGLTLAIIDVPAFVVTELTEAFEIGFLIFIPFLIIDLVVANILLAMGNQSLNATSITLPLKLLLFVMVDGWNLILKGLVLGYAS